MAEGGGEDGSGGNPFSFKQFVKKQSEDPDAEEDDEKPVVKLDLPDIADASNEKPAVKERKPDDVNPFSFKKFLQGGAPSGGSRVRAGASSLATLDLANDLPDFVQHGDHQHRHGQQAHALSFGDSPLPDFALDSQGCKLRSQASSDSDSDDPHHVRIGVRHPADPLEDHRGGQHSSRSPLELNPRFSDNEGEEEEEDSFDAPSVMCTANSTGGLPDFLSDSAIGGASQRTERNNLVLSHNGFLGDVDSSDELQRLREENRELRRQLNEARELAEAESKRVSGVLGEMETIQKREAEENAALENMIQQVEANLHTTTQRAATAESTISKLKQEVKSLQAVKQSLQLENSALRGGQGGHDPVRERAKYASEQLAVAAKSAEQSLKQLLSGVGTLKMVSDVLASIDKITDATDSSTDSSSAGGATNSPGGATGGVG